MNSPKAYILEITKMCLKIKLRQYEEYPMPETPYKLNMPMEHY
jgi:hypothetical protein